MKKDSNIDFLNLRNVSLIPTFSASLTNVGTLCELEVFSSHHKHELQDLKIPEFQNFYNLKFLNSSFSKGRFLASNLCPSLGCQAGCHPSPSGGVCTCPVGYKLDERFHRTCSGKKYYFPVFEVPQSSNSGLEFFHEVHSLQVLF